MFPRPAHQSKFTCSKKTLMKSVSSNSLSHSLMGQSLKAIEFNCSSNKKANIKSKIRKN